MTANYFLDMTIREINCYLVERLADVLIHHPQIVEADDIVRTLEATTSDLIDLASNLMELERLTEKPIDKLAAAAE